MKTIDRYLPLAVFILCIGLLFLNRGDVVGTCHIIGLMVANILYAILKK